MKVSIITPVYNSQRFIQETISSVLNQTYTDWELILVDDCSIDNSEEIIKSIQRKDDRIKYIKLEKNSGAAIARNKAIENAEGRFIAFLDSDDVWKQDKLEKQLRFMLNKKIGFSFTSYETINEYGEKLGTIRKAPKEVDYEYLLKNTAIGCLTVILDKNIIGDFRMPIMRTRQDFATWLSILKKGHIAYGLNEVLAEYRLVEGSISSNKIKAAKQNWYVYRNVENLSLPKSVYVFMWYAINAVKKKL